MKDKKSPSLVILAAGMGSRYGGLKQLDSFGPNGETIIDYSIYDALQAGFEKIVFVIRKSFEKDFTEHFKKVFVKADCHYVFQELDTLKEDYKNRIPENRTKPWGTAHAIYTCRDAVTEPFAMINADDFYGRQSFELTYKHLAQLQPEKLDAVLMAYCLKNTLSENGSVTRGVCALDEQGFLKSIIERFGVRREDGQIFRQEGEEKIPLDDETPVSMNLMGFTPQVFPIIEKAFYQFFDQHAHEPKSELFIPAILNDLVVSGLKVPVLQTTDAWVGVTYQEDKPIVRQRLQNMVEQGIYPENL